ncbi:type 1 fimbrial protein [Achromobacter sp. SD115]|uniref:fimbrial protein n=1 Tax=Achromobacter sp. SD115 TaxID=2782011 RepID=UPI001A97B145|nr:fimbrial protein [Achromobacter sp. SD115]MBO1014522.1 type 1 fimbrial protein [Achromobacter sp. SD115]
MKNTRAVKGRQKAAMLALSCLALMLGAYAPQSQAACTLGPGIAQNVININLGNILVPPGRGQSKVDPIADRKYPISHKDGALLRCSDGGGKAMGSIHMGSRVDDTSIYRTNIPGIGIRIGLRPGDHVGSFYFPYSWGLDHAGTEGTIGPKGWIHVQLFKISPTTGNGALEAGLYASLYAQDAPGEALRVRIDGRTTSIITPSCTAAPTPPVRLGKVWKNLFSSVGSTAAEQSFNIKLNCREAKPELNSVYLRMDAKPDASGTPGVIALSPDANAATGVGIQILDKDRQPVAYGQSALVGVSKDGVYDVPFHARYYQTASQVTAGVANGTATFTLEYK